MNHDPQEHHYVDLNPYDKPLQGRVRVPGSKSLTNRALLIAALAQGESTLNHALKSDDTRHMANALRAMGVEIEEPNDHTFIVRSHSALQASPDPLFTGNAGTAMRFLTAACASIPGTHVLDGDEYMRQRPIGPLVTALSQTGIHIEATGDCPPVTVHGRTDWERTHIMVDGQLSTQYISALLMAAPLQGQPVIIELPDANIGARGYIHLTMDVMKKFGVSVTVDEAFQRFEVQPQRYHATHYSVEPDASTATYFWAASAITSGIINTSMDPTRMSQPDAKAYHWIREFPNMAPVIDGAQMQDAIPTLATLAALNGTPVKFTGLKNLRVKECDRIVAICHGLNTIQPGLATEGSDWLQVNADPFLIERSADNKATIETFDDHRIAMAFAILGVKVPGIRIKHPGCVAKTFPEFWQTFESLGVQLDWVS